MELVTTFPTVFRIPIDLNTDLDPYAAYQVNTEQDPGFVMTKMKERKKLEQKKFSSVINCIKDID